MITDNKRFENLPDAAAVEAAQRQLEHELSDASNWDGSCKLGSRGGNVDTTVYWLESGQFWYGYRHKDPKRWLNGFGATDPRKQKALHIGLWVNPDRSDPTRGYGRFVRDDSGAVYFAHNGRIGGGRPGIGQKAFLESLDDRYPRVIVAGQSLVLIAQLGSETLVEDCARYVHAVNSFKAMVTDVGEDDEEDDDDDENDEEDEADDSDGDDGPTKWGLDELFSGAGPETRNALLHWVAEVIRHAHELSPHTWVLTRRGRKFLRVNVGRNVSFEIRRGAARVGLGLALPSFTGDPESIAPDGREDFSFVDVHEGVLRRISTERFLAARDSLRSASLAFIKESAKAFKNTPFARYHASDLLEAIEAELGTTLPRPVSRIRGKRKSKDRISPESPGLPSFEQVSAAIQSAGLHFPSDVIASYLLALQAKRFVILSGISGTGKTEIARGVARAFQRRIQTAHPRSAPTVDSALRIEPATHRLPEKTYEVIAVRPDWTDNRGLLGYYNPILREYTPTPFLRLLLRAKQDADLAALQARPATPYFVVLDEMNLARVEHYFSDFLSSLESGEPLHLHDDPATEEGLGRGEAIPQQLRLPTNLYFTGTVNVDETTYMFSPKVLDRAFVLEFNEVDLRGLASGQVASHGALALPSFDGLSSIDPSQALTEFQLLLDGDLFTAMDALHKRLELDHRHFGYRVAKEIASFVVLASEQADDDPETLRHAFDVAVIAKVLPKLHGTQQEIGELLGRLLAFALNTSAPLTSTASEDDCRYYVGTLTTKSGMPPSLPRSAAKLWRMLRRVRLQGYVSFIE